MRWKCHPRSRFSKQNDTARIIALTLRSCNECRSLLSPWGSEANSELARNVAVETKRRSKRGNPLDQRNRRVCALPLPPFLPGSTGSQSSSLTSACLCTRTSIFLGEESQQGTRHCLRRTPNEVEKNSLTLKPPARYFVKTSEGYVFGMRPRLSRIQVCHHLLLLV